MTSQDGYVWLRTLSIAAAMREAPLYVAMTTETRPGSVIIGALPGRGPLPSAPTRWHTRPVVPSGNRRAQPGAARRRSPAATGHEPCVAAAAACSEERLVGAPTAPCGNALGRIARRT